MRPAPLGAFTSRAGLAAERSLRIANAEALAMALHMVNGAFPLKAPAKPLRPGPEGVEVNVRNETVIAPRVQAHLIAYRAALDELRRVHRQVADETNLDLNGDSRQAAAWLVSGRILGLLEAAMTLAHAGFASEIGPVLRTVHEANQLLRALAVHRDTAVLRDWLAGQHIKPTRVRSAEDRFQRTVSAEMREGGIEPPKRTREFMEAVYGFLSEMAHVRRSRVYEIASPESRMMPIGPHPDARVRAVFVYYTGTHVLEAVSAVGFAFAVTLGDDELLRMQRTLAALFELFEKVPLDPATLGAKGPSRPSE